MKVYIYGLREVGTTEIRYVGQTIDPDGRLKSHRRSASVGSKHPNKAWIGEVYGHGGAIELCIIEECVWQNAGEKEKFWMDYYRPFGNLTNVGSAKKKSSVGRPRGKNFSFYFNKEQMEEFKKVQEYYGMSASKTITTLILEYHSRELKHDPTDYTDHA